MHLEIAAWLGRCWEQGDRRLVLLVFRNAGKSTLVGIFCAWLPEAGYSYLQLGLLLAWEGHDAARRGDVQRAVELQDQDISGNAGLQVVGANGRLGYVYYLQGRYDEALREYERGLSFVASSDHALKDRTAIELTVKMGAAYHRQDRPIEAAGTSIAPARCSTA